MRATNRNRYELSAMKVTAQQLAVEPVTLKVLKSTQTGAFTLAGSPNSTPDVIAGNRQVRSYAAALVRMLVMLVNRTPARRPGKLGRMGL